MKRILSVLLVLIFIVLSMITVGAEPVSPESYVSGYFEDFYSNVEEDALTVCINADMKDIYFSDLYGLDKNDYMLVKFTSNSPTQEPYFNRFGSNEEYYECSDVTNLLFKSGIAVFCGNYYTFPENHNEDFYTIEEILEIQPKAFEEIMDYLGPQYVGRIGDADKDGELSVIDATEIQRYIAKLSVISNEKIADVDNDGFTDVLDATAIQLKLAGLE